MEVSFEVLCISNVVIFASEDILQSFAFLVTFQSWLVKLIIDGLVLFVINQRMQDTLIFLLLLLLLLLIYLLFLLVSFEEFLLRSG